MEEMYLKNGAISWPRPENNRIICEARDFVYSRFEEE
jgi:hypothetical protein